MFAPNKPSSTFLNVSASFLLLLLAGCGPSIDCTQNVDGERLLKSLSDPKISLESAAQNAIQLTASCKPKKDQQALIDHVAGKIASSGSMQLQADFYTKISNLIPDSPLRLNFITHSSLINGTIQSSTEQLHLLEFEQLGTPFDRKIATPMLTAAFNKLGLNEVEPGYIRKVETDGGVFVLARSTDSQGFTETSEIRFFDSLNARQVKVPEQNFNYLLHRTDDKSLNDYFFACKSLAGDGCGSRDTRYAVDKNNKLKYIVSLLYSDLQDDEHCGVDMDVSQVTGTSINRAVAMAQSKEIKCDIHCSSANVIGSISPTENKGDKCEVPPSFLANGDPIHGDPFHFYSNQEILAMLAKTGSYPNLADLVNFKIRDAADSELKARLWSQGDRWKMSLLEKAVKTIDIDIANVNAAKTTNEAYKTASAFIGTATETLENLKWLLSNPTLNPELATQLAVTANEVKTLQSQIETIKPTSPPESPPAPLYPYERVSIGIIREAQDAEAIIRSPDTPFVYYGVTVPLSYNSKKVLLYSQKMLADRRMIVTVLAIRGKEPLQYMIDGFTQNVWSYATLSEQQKTEYDDYVKLQQKYQKQLADYKISQGKAVVKANEIVVGVNKLFNSFQRVFAVSVKSFTPSSHDIESPTSAAPPIVDAINHK